MGCLLVRNSSWLPETFAVHPEYLRDVDRGNEEVNFRDYGIQLTRSFRALKLWMSLKVFGLDAFRRAVSHGIDMAEAAEAILQESPGWEVVTEAQLGIITFRYAPGGVEPQEADGFMQRMVEGLANDGYAYLSTTELRGELVLRLCTINPATTVEDIQGTIARLEELGVRAQREPGQ
jgi:glutamate/tyrosine decarboxylase-like PLP-dependent enzyme